MKLDNLRIPDLRDPAIPTAVRFMDSIERGTAFSPVVLDTDGVAMPKGTAIIYRALAGDVYDAKIVAVRSAELVDIDVILPGCANPVHLTKIKFLQEG